jgi:hypothetical protein
MWPESGTEIDVRVDLFYDAAWNDITSYVDEDITITRGLSANANQRVADPAEVSLTLLNDDARFTLTNVTSPLFGKIGRNTLLRVRVLYNTGASTSTRGVGEVPMWRATPDDRNGDLKVTVPVSAFGVLRRLQQRADLGDSPLSRYYRGATNLAGYWSLEDGPGRATSGSSFGSHVSGAGRMTVTGGTCGDRTDGLVASDPVPTLASARLQAACKRSSFLSTAWTAIAHVVMPTSVPVGGSLVQIGTNGSAHDFYLQVGTDCSVSFVIGDQVGGVITSYGPSGTTFEGRSVKFRFVAEQAGSDFTYALSYLFEGETSGVALTSGTVVGKSCGRPQVVVLNTDSEDMGDLGIGHIAVYGVNSVITNGAEEFGGFDLETIPVRIDRLATEAGASALTDPITTSVPLGPQQRGSVVAAMREAVEPDGVLFDQRTQLALTWYGYAARVDPTEVTVPYGDLVPPVRVESGDADALNDSTVTRRNGATARVEATTGALGVDTIGRYAEQVTVPLGRDADVIQVAGMRTTIGTHNEPRLPSLTIDVHTASTTLRTAVLDGSLDIGSRVVVTGLPASMGGRPLRQIVEGYTEVISRVGWWLTLYCTPAAPYDFLVLDDTNLGLLSPSGATLSAAITTTTATSMSVATPAGKPLWATFSSGRTVDLIVSGVERVRATVITGTSSPQPFTITRGIDGYATTHLSGASVELYNPRRLGL